MADVALAVVAVPMVGAVGGVAVRCLLRKPPLMGEIDGSGWPASP